MSEFNPYNDNGGTVVAVAVGDRIVIGGDTRLSNGYNILSRTYNKVTQLTSSSFIATSGQVTDAQNLHKLLLARVVLYKHQHGAEPSLHALSKLLSVTLYSRRFFPFYTFNLLCGIDADGQAKVFGYDAIGSFDELKYGAQGSGQQLSMSILDNQMKGTNRNDNYQFTNDPVKLVKDVFNAVAERDIHTGDHVMLWDVSPAGTQCSTFRLRAD
jgi:20S proteasome subunit beta 6